MATLADLNQTIGRLRTAVDARLTREQVFKQEIITNINRHLANLGVCINAALAAPPGSGAAALANQTYQQQINDLTTEIGRLSDMAEIDPGQSTQIASPVRDPNLRWDSASNRRGAAPSTTGFLSPFSSGFFGSPVASPPGSQPSSTGFFGSPVASPPGSQPSSTGMFGSPVASPPGSRPVKGLFEDDDDDSQSGGWTPKRRPKTPKRSPKKSRRR
jgi:hypothetical protein